MVSTIDSGLVEELLKQAVDGGKSALSEYDSKRLLAAYGIPATEEELAQNPAEAVAAAERLGYPVAVKACSAELLHKSDQGLVRLNLGSPEAVEAAVADIEKATNGAALEGYLVQQMVSGKREVIAGAMRDESFGACVMLGLGGILVEAIGDVAFRLAPLEERDALEMIGEIRAQPIFDEFRGEPEVDRQALSEILVTLGKILDAHPEVAQVDVNPLIFEGARPVAVDALVTLKTQ